MILAIDPGLSGALALYDPISRHVTTYDVPLLLIRVNNKNKNQPDMARLIKLFQAMGQVATHVIIEEPGSMPKQGVTSAFTFGHICGVLQAFASQLEIPLTLVRPGTWKKVLQLTANKDLCRKRASQLFPACAHQWTRKRDDGRAEAALLAYYHHHTGGTR